MIYVYTWCLCNRIMMLHKVATNITKVNENIFILLIKKKRTNLRLNLIKIYFHKYIIYS